MTIPPERLYPVLAAPADDTPRLVLADWLEENAGTVRRCSGTHSHGGTLMVIDGVKTWFDGFHEHSEDPRKPHHHCDAKCEVSDGRAERAEFIRVQCELARLRAGADEPTADTASEMNRLWGERAQRMVALERREERLWPLVAASLAPDLPGVSVGTTNWYRKGGPLVVRDIAGNDHWWQPDRGFVGEVRCTLAAFVGEPCPRTDCFNEDGNGPDPECLGCNGTGKSWRTPGVVAALFAAHPVTRVVATDFHPMRERDDLESHLWWRPDATHPVGSRPWILPDEFFDWLPGCKGDWAQWVLFETQHAANAALSDVLVAHGRAVAAGHTHDAPCPKCRGQKGDRYGIGLNCVGVPFGGCDGRGTVTRPGLPPLPAGDSE